MFLKFSYPIIFFIFFCGCSNISSNNTETGSVKSEVQESSNFVKEVKYELATKTYLYALKGSDSLELDLYWNQHQVGSSPLVVFVHGGGFYAGTRKEKNIDTFCKELCKEGFAVANMDYRLHLKGQSFHCDQPSPNKIKAFEVCVNDIRSATQFLMSEQKSCQIQPNEIFLIGSSAGAEAILHAASWANDEYTEGETPILAQDFQYKGAVAMAGAMIDTTLISSENVIPHMLFHGTCDPLVPYASDIHHYCPENSIGGLLLHGSWSIMERIKHLNGNYILYSYCGEGHKIASIPLAKHSGDIVSFLNQCLENEDFQDHFIIKDNNAPCKYGGNQPFCD